MVVGIVTGKLNPLFEHVKGNIDDVLVMIGWRESISVTPDDFCFSLIATFGGEEGTTEKVTFEHCYERKRESCTLRTFSSGSTYYYFPKTQEFGTKREDTGISYELDITKVDAAKTDDVKDITENEIFYNSVAFLYSLFGITPDKEGRVMGYDIHGYMKSGMDKKFGQFHDMLIIYGGDSRVYFMEANGRFFIYDIDDYDIGGLTWIQRNVWGLSTVGINRDLVTPIMGAFDDVPDWTLYHGTDRAEALSVLAGKYDTYFTDDDDIRYSICNPEVSNSVYRNCYRIGTFKEKGDIDVLLEWIYDTYSSKDSALVKPTFGDTQLDSQYEYDLLDFYLKRRFGNSKNGIIRDDAVDTLKKIFEEDNSFQIRGVNFLVSAGQSTSTKLPLVIITSEDGSQKYYLRFNGNTLYYEGKTDFFFSEGNQITAPFILFNAKTKKEVVVDRTFTQTESEDSLDKQVLGYFREKCP